MSHVNEQAEPAQNGGGVGGRVMTGTVEPSRGPVSRADLITMLRGAGKVLSAYQGVKGAVYVLGLAARIQDALSREPEIAGELGRADVCVEVYSRGLRLIDQRGLEVSLRWDLIEYMAWRRQQPGQVIDLEVKGEFAASSDVEVRP
jgi:hypothetical protein